MGKKLGVLLLVLFLLVPAATAISEKQGSTKLLAVLKKDGKQFGTVATLDLDMQTGKNRVFLETFPLTQVSTQVSMRFAQQMACSALDADCSDYDFFYTIKSLPGVVGGPSAGAAAAVLTASLLLNKPIRKDASITGTINSGGIIGAVGGLKGKIKAASENGINLVLIPHGTRMLDEGNKNLLKNATNNVTIDGNATKLDLVEYGRNLSVNVSEVATLAEAIELLTGHKIKEPKDDFVLDPGYLKTMKEVSQELCKRNDEIIKQRKDMNTNFSEEEITSLNYTNMSKKAFDSGEYYSSASYCFRSSVVLKQNMFRYENLTDKDIVEKIDFLKNETSAFEKNINKTKIKTITGLQTMMAVTERINEAGNAVSKALENKEKTTDWLAYAEERLYSAKAWSKFFNGGNAKFELDEERLRLSCQSKINEVEERYNYLKIILPTLLKDIRKDIDDAYDALNNKQYVSCLYQAIKYKSEIDVLLGLIGVEEERVDDLLDLKLKIAKQALVKTQQKGIFPIISYSYYEYANSLKEMDQTSALLFSQYALEFANLDIYFPPKKKFFSILKKIDKKILLMFVLGLFAGIILMWNPRKKYKTLQTPQKKRLRGKKR
ncbi:hypothetical protein KY346_01845 [Candidatus Woesearchaeota archaeon]|nr:hypothetical protein [Candidatus Woesearchaeota archaeon]